MKGLKDIIQEKLKISNSNTQILDIYDTDLIVDYLMQSDKTNRQAAITTIYEEVQNLNLLRIRFATSIERSTKYCVEFGKASYKDDDITFIQIIHRYGSNYETIGISTGDSWASDRPYKYIDGWNTTRANISPGLCELYEIPSDSILNEIFKKLSDKI